MPSFGSPSSGATDGEEGPSAPSSDGPPMRKPRTAGRVSQRRGMRPTRPAATASKPSAAGGFRVRGPASDSRRDLAVYIEAGRIYVGSQPPIACGRRETSEQLGIAVLRAVNREARTWGRPRDNFYWVPNLKIVVCAAASYPMSGCNRPSRNTD